MLYDGMVTTLRCNLRSSETPWGYIGPWNSFFLCVNNMHGHANVERSFIFLNDLS